MINLKWTGSQRDIYYGWVIVAVAMVSMAFWFGIRSSFSIFYVALLEDFPWNRGDSAGVQSMALITYTIMAPLVGGLIDRFGPRRIVLPGILVLTLGLMLCGTTNTLIQFYLYYGVIMGTGITCIGIVTYSAILAHWFEKKRGVASGMAVSGMGIGTFLLVPLSQQFISMLGWRPTFLLTGGLALIILFPVNALFLRHKPRELGQYPDGLDEAEVSKQATIDVSTENKTAMEWTIKEASRTVRFWALMMFPFSAVLGVYIILVHHVKFMVDQGIDKMTAAFIFALVGVVSSVFRIFWGWLSDRIGRELTFTLGITCACLGVVSLLFIETFALKQFAYSFFVLFGMGWGVTAPMLMSVSADLFKGKIYGLIYGFVEAGVGIAGATGAWVAGVIFDQTQSYTSAFILAIVAFVFSCFFVWIAAPRKYRTQ